LATAKGKKAAVPTKREERKLNQQEIKAKICALVASGLSLAKICSDEEIGVGYSTVFTWLRDDAEFQEHYARAREDRADVMFDELDDVSEAAQNAATAVEVAGLRLKADNIKWKLARLNAKKYGDRTQIDANVKAELQVSVTDEQAKRIAREVLGADPS